MSGFRISVLWINRLTRNKLFSIASNLVSEPITFFLKEKKRAKTFHRSAQTGSGILLGHGGRRRQRSELKWGVRTKSNLVFFRSTVTWLRLSSVVIGVSTLLQLYTPHPLPFPSGMPKVVSRSAVSSSTDGGCSPLSNPLLEKRDIQPAFHWFFSTANRKLGRSIACLLWVN